MLEVKYASYRSSHWKKKVCSWWCIPNKWVENKTLIFNSKHDESNHNHFVTFTETRTTPLHHLSKFEICRMFGCLEIRAKKFLGTQKYIKFDYQFFYINSFWDFLCVLNFWTFEPNLDLQIKLVELSRNWVFIKNPTRLC